jgi:predicted DNA-binding ribbon-helix-helix protein
MRTTKTFSVSLPPEQLKEMERTARNENCTMSELVGELYRRYRADEARREFAHTLATLRAEAAKTPAGKLTPAQIDREIAAVRNARKSKSPR